MASLPAPQPSQRRSYQGNNTSSPQTQSSPSPARTRSQDSQTIFSQPRDEHYQPEQEQRQQQQQRPASAVARQNSHDDASDKKCWICFSDSSEDTPDSSPWRDPCPCALVAHEECLLDWIADMEAPKNNRSRSVSAPKIECPQCKSEIKLARPTNYIVDAVRSFERIGAKIVTPGAIMTLSGVVYSSSMAWGAHSVYAVFGADDGFRILRPIIYNATRAPVEVYAGSPGDATRQLLAVLIDHFVHWRLYVGLPLITPVLILSRTHFADGLLPVLPIVFFASPTPPHGVIDFGSWPPSASFVFAILPYVRSMYNTYYERFWAAKERRWLKEIQPRAGQSQGEGDEDADAGQAGEQERRRNEDENVFEVRIDGGIWEEWADEEHLEQPAQHNHAPMMHQPQMHHDDDEGLLPPQAHAAPQQQQQQQQQPQAAQAPQQAQQEQPAQPQPQPQAERRLSFSPTAIAETILGALVFPTIAGLSGEALKLVLPTSWTTTPAASPRFNGRSIPRGLLQQKWGRSIVGGCLFVVCKDALMLYVRWKMAQMHRRRRVVDYDRRKDATRRVSTS